MDKGFGSVSSSTSGNGGSSSEMYLKQVSKNSHKISKPLRKPLPAVASSAAASAAAVPILEPITQPQQPPVYNINKNDFRDVVQKLTGSPSHERFSTPPPPVSQPRPSSSRLQRIRPPPLAQIGNRPPQLTQVIPRPPNDFGQRAVGPPLPPFPSVHPASESPISAYMRFIQSSAIPSAPSPLWNGVATNGPLDSRLPQNEVGQRGEGAHPRPLSQLQPIESPISTYMRFLQSSANASSTALPRWNGVGPPLPPHPLPHSQQQKLPPPSSSAWPSPFPVLPLSPLPFGCVPSPRSPYAMVSPSLFFSPSNQLGFPQLPLSPTVPLPSPSWKGM